ncbi:hypothetical protein [Pyrodictium delaneyi]|uniref:hypothetical protein n=1 Tax=Pyrodictium delaneyi TaxID=1273541 RepID=UPI00117B096C|nr:hypothetical protein [Pyrodictium delaneyi]
MAWDVAWLWGFAAGIIAGAAAGVLYAAWRLAGKLAERERAVSECQRLLRLCHTALGRELEGESSG